MADLALADQVKVDQDRTMVAARVQVLVRVDLATMDQATDLSTVVDGVRALARVYLVVPDHIDFSGDEASTAIEPPNRANADPGCACFGAQFPAPEHVKQRDYWVS